MSRTTPDPSTDTSLTPPGGTQERSNTGAFKAVTPPDPPYDRQAVLLQPPPLWSRILIWTLGLGTVSLIAWAWVTRVDETVSMDGQIETASPEAKVTSANDGMLAQVYVRPHQIVQRGAPLFRLSDSDVNSSIAGLETKLARLDEQRRVEHQLYDSKVAQLQIQASLHRSILERLTRLSAVGAAQEVQVMERQSSLQETLNSLETQKEELAKSDNALAIQEVETRNAIQELQNKRNDMLVVAPVSGTVHNMRLNASGERVQAGEEMATIVPHLQLLAAVSVPSRVSAPVKPGHAARVSVDAFPSNEYGELRGRIISISPNTNPSEEKDKESTYRAMIAINRRLVPARFPLNQLRPGMGLKAKVKLRDRAVITLVFDFMEKLTAPLTQRR